MTNTIPQLNIMKCSFALSSIFAILLYTGQLMTAHATSQPNIAIDDEVTVSEDVSASIEILANDAPVGDLDMDSFAITLAPSYGSYSIEQNSALEVVYEPYANFFGDDLFEYQICNSSGSECGKALVSIHVESVNDQIVAMEDSATASIGASIEIDVLANDLDHDFDMDPSTLSLVSLTSRGPIEIVNQRISYTAIEFGGIDQFSYQICDSPSQPTAVAACSIATVQIVIGDVEVATQRTTPNRSTNITVGNRPEDRSTQSTIQIVDSPINGSATINFDGTIQYQPTSGFLGTDTFLLEVCESPSECEVVEYVITVGLSQILLPFVNLQ